MLTLGQPEAFIQAEVRSIEADGIGAASRKFLQEWMDRYVAWVKHGGGENASSTPATTKPTRALSL